eukprot:gene25522-31190_t
MYRDHKDKPSLSKKSYKSLVFVAVLIGFPLSNVLIFMGSVLWPKEYEVTPGYPGGPANLREKNIPSVLIETAAQPTLPEEWPKLEEMVENHDLYSTYETFYNSGSQSWRISKYGRVCIISDTFLGAVVSSGVGTALTTLAEVLSANGFDVTLLYTKGRSVETATIDFWTQYYGSHGIKFVPLPATPVAYDVPQDIALSHRVYVWLQQQQWYDVVHFADNRGRAYFTLTAKQQGIAFDHTHFVLHAHSPHLWYKMNSLQMLDTLHDLILDHLERTSARLADKIIAPTKYMLDWMHENGWQVSSENVAMHPNILPAWVHRQSRVVLEDVVILEVVFFGRLELKKGLVLFCDTLDQLTRDPKSMDGIKARSISRPLSVSFLGRLPESNEERLM